MRLDIEPWKRSGEARWRKVGMKSLTLGGDHRFITDGNLAYILKTEKGGSETKSSSISVALRPG